MSRYKNYQVWRNSKFLVKEVYSVMSKLPSSEKYGLESQIKRAAISIPANIAEGVGRRTQKDFRGFLHIALGSSYELDTLLELTRDLGFLKPQEVESLQRKLTEVKKQLNSLISKISSSLD